MQEVEVIRPIEAKIVIKGKPSENILNHYRDKHFDILLKNVVFNSLKYHVDGSFFITEFEILGAENADI